MRSKNPNILRCKKKIPDGFKNLNQRERSFKKPEWYVNIYMFSRENSGSIKTMSDLRKDGYNLRKRIFKKFQKAAQFKGMLA